MRELIRRWLRVDPPPAPLPAPSAPPKARAARAAQRETRLMTLESRVDFLELEVNKLRGKITGGLAHKPKPQEEPQSLQDAPESTNGHQVRVEPPPDRWLVTAQAKGAKNRAVLSG